MDEARISWASIEAAVRRDPARRGLASFNDADGPLLVDQLRQAALDLAAARGPVVIVTGFAIRTEHGVVAETDGPPGAIYLNAMLSAVGITTYLVTDVLGEPVLRAGLAAMHLNGASLLIAPKVANDAAGREAIRTWRRTVLEPTGSPSHLVAVERVGPGHTLESITPEHCAEFVAAVALPSRNVCRNMRGVSLDDCTAPLHVLFERDASAAAWQPRTIGVVDGGNEIGCGNIPWHVLRRAVAQGCGGTIACRIKTDYALLAGVSNWGAYALGATVALLREGRNAVEVWTAEQQQRLVEAIVRDGGAVDGVTKRREPTVDGLALPEYLGVFEEIRTLALQAR